MPATVVNQLIYISFGNQVITLETPAIVLQNSRHYLYLVACQQLSISGFLYLCLPDMFTI